MSNEPDSPEENYWEAADAESTPIEKNAAGPELHDPGALGGASADAAEETATEGQESTVEEDLEGAEEFQNESFVENEPREKVEDYADSSSSGYDDNIDINQQRSRMARIWDSLKPSVRRKLYSWGYEPPLDARCQSSLGRGPLENGEAIIIGPMKAGKTTFVGAIQQACLLTKVKENMDYVLHFNPAAEDNKNNVSLQDLINQNILQMLQPGMLGSTEFSARYEFNIKGNLNKRNRPQVFDLGCAFFDNPGELMFPSSEFEEMDNMWKERTEQRAEMIKEAKAARILILFFDSTKRYTAQLRILLPKILDAIRGENRVIQAKRVLIMLNKVDTFSNAIASKNRRIGMTPMQIAETLDPLMLLRRCIGFANISMFFDYMTPDAELAVSLVSTTGFQENGYPLFDHNGTSMIQTNESVSTNNDKTECWDPYGVYESLVFLATGKIAKQNMTLVDRYNIGNQNDE